MSLNSLLVVMCH